MTPVAALLGPTASGKSALAMRIAARTGAEIVSVDSMQVYRGMDIGTAKPAPQDRRRVPHHLIDLADPEDMFTVAEFQASGRPLLERLVAEGTPALIVGGSGLHFRSLVDPLDFPPSDPGVRAALEGSPPDALVERLVAVDPEAGAAVDLANPRRVIRALEIYELTGETPSSRRTSPQAAAVRNYVPDVEFVAVGVDPGDELAARVADRFDSMLEIGLLDEVRTLEPRLGVTARNAVGYRQLIPVVAGTATLDEGRRRSIDATTSLARRQRTFFRRDPRIRWLQWEDDPDTFAIDAQRALEEAGWTS